MIRKLMCAALFALTAHSAGAIDFNNMTHEEREGFRAAVRAYLLDNPEVIFEAVEVFEERKAVAQAQGDVGLINSNAKAIFDDGYSYVGGNPDGDITIVEFLDYRCGYCKKAFADVSELIASDGNIRFIVKEFPILGEESTLASRFAIATRISAGADAYKGVHDELMIHRGSVNAAALKRIARNLSLDYSEIAKVMDSAAVNKELEANYALGQALAISGTPSFVFQNEMLRGYAPLDAMRGMVAQIRG